MEGGSYLVWYKNEYFIRRLHSLSGIFPLGIFLIEHTFVNSTARYGSEAYNLTVSLLQSLPLLLFLEMALIVIPLLFHALFGIYIVYLAKNNTLQYTYYRNWAFYLQRITAIITFIFVLYHVWALRIGHAIYGFEINFQSVGNHFANPTIFWFYVVGVIASMYHFGNGLTTFLISWGVTTGPHSQRYAAWLGNIVFLGLTLVGLGSLLAFI
ncbi:MAG: succinate dehydrogenase [Desulfitibacter sp. BRH_c19]|nr:MAG: succinate dehydrogenase [Desulfitibacter sp. BRH_c19]